MSNTWLLTKLFLKNGTSEGSGKKANRRSRLTAMFFLITIGGLPLLYFISKGVYTTYPFLKAMGQEGLLTLSILSIMTLVTLVFGILTVIMYFYFSSDVEILLPLPILPRQIVAAKLITVIIMQYAVEALILLPVLINYGVAAHLGSSYYVTVLILFILLPMVPLVISLLVTMLLMRFINIGKNKERIRLIVGIFGLASAYLMKNLFDYLPGASYLSNSGLALQSSLFAKLSSFIVSLRFGDAALQEAGTLKGWLYLFLFVAISIAFAVLAFFVADRLYFKGLLGLQNTGATRKTLNKNELTSTLQQRSIIRSYFVKDMRILLRTTPFLLYGVGRSLLVPAIAVGSVIMNYGLIMEGNEFSLQDVPLAYQSLLLSAFVFAVIFMGTVNTMGTTPLTREGKNAMFMKYIPVSYTKQLFAKVLPTVLFNSLNILAVTIIAWLFKMPLLLMIEGIILCSLVIIFSSLTGLILDLHSPSLDWDNEYTAVRPGLKILTNLALSLLSGSFMLLFLKVTVMPLTAFVSIFIVYLVLIVLLLLYLKVNAQKLMHRLM
ncbi:hypothetical protein A374_06561 [Fictibacillus macauensis ZFHKF-1]|uniref:Uncharacterized protein n=1 Tax=Fictibacillus macauensis ZFHKF-1 TaxID=1196324 RepID=I8UH61_9BACL|nr:hypothetical protein [Fictibacillus macauensis]EIT86240.1 hypothetical protein A374_06561 [Fictibacillus macauensis ZFHKF-1]